MTASNLAVPRSTRVLVSATSWFRGARALFALLALAALGCLTAQLALAQKHYGPGATDTEIKIGQTMPYSGPGSPYSAIGRAEAAYFEMINASGGVNSRKIKLISLDDAYSPSKTVEMTRRLVEQDEVLAIFGSLGTAHNSTTRAYLNGKKVSQIFLASGATKFSDPKEFPWTMALSPSYQTEARIYAKYILQHSADAKVAVLYQNDDFGKDYLKGLKDGFGARAAEMIVVEASYEATDPTVDSQIVTLQASGADTFVDVAAAKFAAQAIRKTYDIGWKPLHLLGNISSSISAVLRPAGLDKSVGLITAAYIKDQTDPQWENDQDVNAFLTWMKKYYPDGDPTDYFNAYSYNAAYVMVQALTQCGDDLTRENVMRQAANLRDVRLPMLLPGIKVNTSPTNYSPIRQLMLARFDGKRWVVFGALISE